VVGAEKSLLESFQVPARASLFIRSSLTCLGRPGKDAVDQEHAERVMTRVSVSFLAEIQHVL
jgi:hypothetical protein